MAKEPESPKLSIFSDDIQRFDKRFRPKYLKKAYVSQAEVNSYLKDLKDQKDDLCLIKIENVEALEKRVEMRAIKDKKELREPSVPVPKGTPHEEEEETIV